MVTFPNCKINLGLNIIKKRTDGYHDLESVFYPVSLCDILEITESPKDTELINTGMGVECDMEKNLCYKAYALLKKDFDLPPVRIHLHKIIPFGAGLGGGSSDAAYTIKMLNDFFALNISTTQMQSYAAQVGSDCAFFIESKPVIAKGRGEILKKINLTLEHYRILLIKPETHISTSEAYSGITPAIPKHPIEEIIQTPIYEWKTLLGNDFEKHLFEKHPKLALIKDGLYEAGALYASMSGSGSTIFGLFTKDFDTSKAKEKFIKYETFEREL